MRQQNFNLTAEIGKLKSYSRIVENCHKEEVIAMQNNYTKQSNLIMTKYNQLSELYSNLQENFLKSEKRNAHLQEQLGDILDENSSLVRKVSTLEQLQPVYPTVNDPLDLRLRALEEHYRPVHSPLDLRRCPPETNPPDVVYDLVKF